MATVSELTSQALQTYVDAQRTAIKTLIAPVYNVVGYGAVGDGVTDDTAAVQSAIDAAEAAGGGTVYFPIGTYLITATLTIQTSKVRLVGDGPLNSIIKTAGDITLLSFGTGTTTWIYANGVENLNIVTSNASRTTNSKGILIDYCRNFYLRDVIIQSVYYGVYIKGASDELHFLSVTVKDAAAIYPTYGIYLDGTTDDVVADFLFFHNCVLHGCTTAGFRAEGREFGDLILSNCSFVGGDYGVLLNHTVPYASGDYSADIMIDHCIFDSLDNFGLVAKGLTHLSLTGSWFSFIGKGAGGECIDIEDADFVSLTGNDCRAADYGITLRRVNHSNITGGRVRFVTNTGIRLQGADYNAISGVVVESASIGIHVAADGAGNNSQYNSVTGCTIKVTTTGIQEAASQNPNVYTGNVISATTPVSNPRNSTWEWYDVGASKQYRAQHGIKEEWGTAAPASGTYAVGDIVHNTSPSSGGYIGWTCTVAGTPGTWKGFGTIA